MASTFKFCMDVAYDAAGLFVAYAAVRGLKQLRLFKEDLRTRNKRAARERAVEACQRYGEVYVPLADALYHAKVEAKVASYSGPYEVMNVDKWPAALREEALAKFSGTELPWLPALNALEGIAAAFSTGVADDETGFKLIGLTFCRTVESSYDILSVARSLGEQMYFSGIADTYACWKPRLNARSLDDTKRALEEKLASIKRSSLPDLGPSI